MANKTINQLPDSAGLLITDEFEKQAAGGGQSQKLAADQILFFIESFAAFFSQNITIGNIILNQDGSASFASGITGVNNNGSVSIGGGLAFFGNDGGASFAGGQTTILAADGTVAVGLGAAIILNPDGSASFAAGGFQIQADGSTIIGAANILLNADGSASFAANGFAINSVGAATTNQDIEITDTTKGFILRSPNGTRYRLKVDNAGNLGTELA